MLGTNQPLDVARSPLQRLTLAPRARLFGLALATFVVAWGLWYAAQVVFLDLYAAASISASVGGTTEPIQPDTPLQVTTRGAGVEVEGAQLFRSEVAADGTRSPEQPVLMRLDPLDNGAWQIGPAQATRPLLSTDGDYRLVLRVAAPRPGLMWPHTAFFDQQYRFATVASPHAQLPKDVLQPQWGEPVRLNWSEPMQDLSVTVEPGAPVRSWIDTADPTRTWIQLLDGVAAGQTYTVQVTNAHAADGYAVQQPATFKIAVPARPQFVEVPSAPVTLQYGETFTLKSDGVLARVDASASDSSARVAVDEHEVRLSLPDYRQGAAFDLTVNSAESPMGAPLAAPVTVHLVTPPAFGAPTFSPEDGVLGVQPSVHPSVTFAEPVADQVAAIHSLQIDPPVAGHWEWSAADTAVFMPDDRLPILTDMTLTVHGGPAGPRAPAGGYLEGDQAVTFRTTDYKRMEVSLSHQTMTLFENSQPVRTIYVATGVAAAPTPTGTYYVQMKAPQMRFRGVNPDGSHYDIPDVHWVMPFYGDYTIHGAYWRPRFGVPGSDGCVSMTDSDAKMLYDWADVGTPIVIHS